MIGWRRQLNSSSDDTWPHSWLWEGSADDGVDANRVVRYHYGMDTIFGYIRDAQRVGFGRRVADVFST